MSICNFTHTQILVLRTGLRLRIQVAWWQLAARNDEGLAAGFLWADKDAFSSQAQTASSFNCAKPYVLRLGKLAS